jgi:hypothetical protein
VNSAYSAQVYTPDSRFNEPTKQSSYEYTDEISSGFRKILSKHEGLTLIATRQGIIMLLEINMNNRVLIHFSKSTIGFDRVGTITSEANIFQTAIVTCIRKVTPLDVF